MEGGEDSQSRGRVADKKQAGSGECWLLEGKDSVVPGSKMDANRTVVELAVP